MAMPNARTALNTSNTPNKATPFSATGKPFNQRLDAFLKHAKDTYSITIGKDNGRSVDWQQKHHVAHMFLYNAYRSTKPAKADKISRTIAWEHFSDPKVIWNKITFSDFLRTNDGKIPQKAGLKWKACFEPNKEATIKHIKTMQVTAGIGNGGKAMVSSGLKPCGEPCKCSAGRSKHLENIAADLNSGHLEQLQVQLAAAKHGSLDDYLKRFGLHRPLLNHPSSPEKWHIEATF